MPTKANTETSLATDCENTQMNLILKENLSPSTGHKTEKNRPTALIAQ
jgi:hypothetical protein